MILRNTFTPTLLLLIAINGSAQKDTLKIDTSYYERFPHKLIVTPFLVKNITSFSLSNPKTDERVRYYSNSPVGIGLRLGYDWLSLSGSYKVGIIDPNFSKARGKTKSLNLQTTFAAKDLLVDVYFQQHKGLYARAEAAADDADKTFYVRPDVSTRWLGVTAKYVFNGKQFTARPAFKFDAWQKKSAGSFMAGIELISGSAKGDSAFIPSTLSEEYPQSQVNKIKFLVVGPGAGYGHTFVVDKHFYVMGIGSINADMSCVQEFNAGNSEAADKRWRFDPNFNLRGGIGYNKPSWGISFSYFTKRLYFTGESNDKRYLAHNNDYRLSFTRRLNAGKTIPKAVNWAGNIIKKLGFGFLIE